MSNKNIYGGKTSKYLKKALDSEESSIDPLSMKDIITKLAKKKISRRKIQSKTKPKSKSKKSKNLRCPWNTLRINCNKKNHCYYNNNEKKCLKNVNNIKKHKSKTKSKFKPYLKNILNLKKKSRKKSNKINIKEINRYK